MLTKNSYLEFLRCPQEYWLNFHSPAPTAEPTLHEKHLMDQGFEVLRLAKKMSIFTGATADRVEFHRIFSTEFLTTSADITVTDRATGKLSIYEVKSGTKVKPEYIDDVAFQKLAAEMLGHVVAAVYVITVNNAYVRNGHIDPDGLLIVNDVTAEVAAKEADTLVRTREALKYLEAAPEPNIAEHCDRKLDCGFIRHHFPDVPAYNVTHISRIQAKKCAELFARGILDIRDVPADFALSDRQRRQVEVACSGEPYVDVEAIREELDTLRFPLNFLDYESFCYPVPHFPGIRPYQQMVFQYSLHSVPDHDGESAHAFHLSKNDGGFPPREVAESLFARLGDCQGTVIVWNAAFEKTRNKELGEMFPDLCEFFHHINECIFDLETIFKKELYLHPEFFGRTSIKNILPVLYPAASYKELDIPDGTTAAIRWYHMATKKHDETECQKIFDDLCKYCHLDTLAMVEIYKVLKSL